MKTIRYNVFETNSSSTHSITIKKSDSDIDKHPAFWKWDIDINGTSVLIVGDGFGWDWNYFNDAPNKASYAVTHFKNSPDKLKEIIDSIETRLKKKVIIGGLEHSYIDHQSNGNLGLWLESNNVSIDDFLFEPSIYVITGNDNSSPSIDVVNEFTDANFMMIVDDTTDIISIPLTYDSYHRDHYGHKRWELNFADAFTIISEGWRELWSWDWDSLNYDKDTGKGSITFSLTDYTNMEKMKPEVKTRVLEFQVRKLK